MRDASASGIGKRRWKQGGVDKRIFLHTVDFGNMIVYTEKTVYKLKISKKWKGTSIER